MSKPTVDEMEQFFRGLQNGADRDLFPKMRASFCAVSIVDGTPDVKLCLELGAALYFDKPLILLVRRGQFFVPARLRKLCDAVIEYEDNLKEPKVVAQVKAAMERLMKRPRTQ